MNQSWYRGRPVLVLGGLGFIGWNLSQRLTTIGARVTVVTQHRSAHSSEAVALESSDARVIEADLRDPDAMRQVVAGHETVFHLAAQSGAVRSQEDPFTDLDVNCRGSLVLLEALRARNPEARLVFVGSRLAYGSAGERPAGEDRAPDPFCIHAVHKLTVEKYLRVYGRLFGIRCAVARVTNPYGPGQPAGRSAYGVVNQLIHLALSGRTLAIYGDGRQCRDYIFIDDVVAALLELGSCASTAASIYNVGTGIGTRLIDMARAIVVAAGSGAIELVQWPPMAERIETGDFVADISRIRRETGWHPAVSLVDGLQRTVSFYRAHVES